MRDAFFEGLAELAARDERVWALTGDLGIGLFDPVAEVAPGRVLNVGIAEQALVGMAAGLSYAGKVPFAYSIAPFVTSRANDQIRVDVAIPRANVKLVGVGGGVAYGYLGPTHHAIEDLALMRVLPGMTVLAPGDPGEALRATRAAFATDGPVYLRLGKNGERRVLPEDASFAVGRAIGLRAGNDLTIASTGAMLPDALDAAERLAAFGVDATVLHFGTIKPFDGDALAESVAVSGALITVEEHSIVGGLGSASAEALTEEGVPVKLRRLGLRDEFAHAVGSREYLLQYYGLNTPNIVATALDLLQVARTEGVSLT
jgi:transketolase